MTSPSGANRLQPGRQHAPGVRCIVAVKQDFYGRTSNLNPDAVRDNGKIVVIENLYPAVIKHCPVCGERLVIDFSALQRYRCATALVTLVDKSNFESYWCNHNHRKFAVFFLDSLIPIGDDDLEVSIAAETATGDFTDLHTVVEPPAKETIPLLTNKLGRV